MEKRLTFYELRELSKDDLIARCMGLQGELDDLVETVKETLGTIDKKDN